MENGIFLIFKLVNVATGRVIATVDDYANPLETST